MTRKDLLKLRLSSVVLRVNSSDPFNYPVNQYQERLKKEFRVTYTELEVKEALLSIELDTIKQEEEEVRVYPDDYFQGF